MPGYGAPHCLSGGDKAGPLPHTKGHWETVCTGHASSELQPCVQCYTWTGGVWKCCNPVFNVILGLVGYGNVATLCSMLYLDWWGMEMLQPCVQCYTWTGAVWKCAPVHIAYRRCSKHVTLIKQTFCEQFFICASSR